MDPIRSVGPIVSSCAHFDNYVNFHKMELELPSQSDTILTSVLGITQPGLLVNGQYGSRLRRRY